MTDKFEEELLRRQKVTTQQPPIDKFESELLLRQETSAQPAPAIQPLGTFEAGIGAANKGLIENFLGAPVDIAASALDFGLNRLNPAERARRQQAEAQGVPFEPSRTFRSGPFLGSGQIRGMFNRAGITRPDFEQALPDSSDAAQIAARAGNVIGSSIGFAAAPLAAARAGIGLKGAFAPIVQSAQRAPLAFTAAEAGGISGAAQGAGLAEAFAPGNEGVAIGAEIVGGFTNPAGLAARAFSRIAPTAVTTAKSFSKAGRKDRASEILRERLIEGGEDPETVIRALSRTDTDGTALTSGLKTGSPTLIAMEKKLAADNVKFSNLVKGRVRDSLGDIRNRIDDLAASGNPNEVRLAAIARQDYFQEILTRRISDAQRNAAEAAALIPNTSKRAASETVFSALSGARKDARAIERSLWDKIPRNIAVQPTNLQTASNRLAGELLEEEAIPFAKTVARIINDGGTTGEFLTLRNRLLNRARDLRGQQKFDEARIHEVLADGVLNDISALDIPETVVARQFSRQFNDAFTRTFAGEALATTGRGAPRIPPETLLERAFGAGGTRGNLRLQQLDAAAGFGDDAVRKFGGPSSAGNAFQVEVRNGQQQFLNAIGRETVRDGVVDPARLAAFKSKNQELLTQFPELQDSLTDAGRLTEILKREIVSQTRATRAVARKAAFAKVAGVENPVEAIGRVLRGNAPDQQFRQLARLARNSGPGAVAGLKSSAIDFAISQSRGPNGISFNRLSNVLTQPLSRGQPSVIAIMQRSGAITTLEANRLTKLVKRGSEIETALTTGDNVDQLISSPDAIFDLMVRVTGARIGAQSVVGSSGASIVAAGAGSRFARNLFEKLPATRTTDVLIEAASNPDFAAALLRRTKTTSQRATQQRQINAFLLQAGIIEDEEQ